MSWSMVSKPAVKKVTQALAEEFSTMEPAPGDRPLNSNRLGKIRAWLNTGSFRTACWASCTCVADGKTYRVNGKHGSTVMAEMNGTLPKDTHVIVERYECDTLEDVATLYATFDSRDSLRYVSDINRAFAGSCEQLCGVPLRTINLTVSGMAFEKWEDEVYRMTRPEDRAHLMIEHKEFVLWVSELFRDADAKCIARAPVIAAMYRTYQKSKAAATEFWTAVRDGSGPDHKAADRQLNKLLLTSVVTGGRGPSYANGGKRQLSTRELYVKCLHGWNAWRRKANTDFKFYPSADTPKAV